MFYLNNKTPVLVLIDVKVLKKLDALIPKRTRSPTIESFIIKYLAEKKSGSGVSITQSPKSKHQSTTNGVSIV